jgi:hypothetical protein
VRLDLALTGAYPGRRETGGGRAVVTALIQLDLRTCETMALSLLEEAARRRSVVELCERLGLSWRLIDAVKCSPGRIGCGLSHLRALRLSTPGKPLVILEDDVGVNERFDPVIKVPADADAVYLGASIYGAVDIVDYVGFTNMLAADVVDDDLLRVYNLLSTHAILYLTERFKLATAESILQSLVDHDWEHDKAMAKLQETFTVYALRRPMFFQAANLQSSRGRHQEDVTNIRLEPLALGTRFSLGIGDGWRAASLVREDGLLRWRWDADHED